jgi:SAM-dependent methyltransferase
VKGSDPADASNGWEAVAPTIIESCARSTVGVTTIQAWTRSRPGASVLDLGCGPGGPRSEVLIAKGFAVYGVDAAPSLSDVYRARYPTARVACESAEQTTFFGRTFDGALAWGLMFLLPADVQRRVIEQVARALNAGGQFLFTAPAQVCTWPDLSTGRMSVSLGATAYEAALASAGLSLVDRYVDEGENHYYAAAKS